ncbi:MAG: WG repeat-containing protein [Chitinophagaceae bacterium]|nr:WG repeat-containing protein [Chitinophagaceae bacterium]
MAAVAVDKYVGGGRANKRYDRQWGFIDSTGFYVVKPQYSSADSFKNGKAKVTLNGREFYIDKTGKEIK